MSSTSRDKAIVMRSPTDQIHMALCQISMSFRVGQIFQLGMVVRLCLHCLSCCCQTAASRLCSHSLRLFAVLLVHRRLWRRFQQCCLLQCRRRPPDLLLLFPRPSQPVDYNSSNATFGNMSPSHRSSFQRPII